MNDDDAELMEFAEKIATDEFNEHVRNTLKVVKDEQDSV
jgi:hypothetical protein